METNWPQRCCDLVMKGGITSGVVYPHAVARLAREYRFRSIGGTSAGAIAAALAAAAEHGRASGGFERLEEAATDISGRLLELFHPDLATRPIFRAALAVISHGLNPAGLLLAWGHLLLGYPLVTFLGLLPAAAALGLMLSDSPSPLSVVAVVLLLLVGPSVAVALRLRHALRRELPAQGFGLCSGMRERPGDGPPALTEWLSDTIDKVAGHRGPGGAPLTFGDLRGDGPQGPAVSLSIMTTCIDARRPYRLPFENADFYYRVDEWQRLFPPRVMEWLEVQSRPFEGDPQLRSLPEPQHLPVVVAVRMSLSFPALIAAVPLWTRDYNLRDREQAEQPQRVWFSDGGLSSNFPIHFFDKIWPQWPTFGIMLEDWSPRHHADDRVYLPTDPQSGHRLDLYPVEGLRDFLDALLSSMQDWQDRLQTALPGYRERVVRVRLAEGEGGLNLDMDQEKVARLLELGGEAGETLLDEFDFDSHRWRRFLVSMARLEATLAGLEAAHRKAPPGGRSYADFLAEYPERATEYDQRPEWIQAARADVQDLLDTARAWAEREAMQGDKIPEPDTVLRITPKS